MADILKAKNFFQKSLSKQASDVCIKFCLLVLLIVPLYRALVGGALVLVRKREREREGNFCRVVIHPLFLTISIQRKS